MGIGSRGPIVHIYDSPVGRRRGRQSPQTPGSLFSHLRPVHIGTPQNLLATLLKPGSSRLLGDTENSQFVICAVEPAKE
jgi:hypothetical protein